jgi:hypothetical protein
MHSFRPPARSPSNSTPPVRQQKRERARPFPFGFPCCKRTAFAAGGSGSQGCFRLLHDRCKSRLVVNRQVREDTAIQGDL